jgi:DNA-binding MarR family transcriptional regulator
MSSANHHSVKSTNRPEIISDKTLRSFFGYQMKRTFNVIQADLNETLADFDLRMVGYSVLVMVVDNHGIRQSQIAEALSIEAPNLVLALDELEQRDLIIRERLKTDRRVWLIRATLPGRRLCQKAIAAVRQHEQKLFSGLEAKQLAKIMEILKRIELQKE